MMVKSRRGVPLGPVEPKVVVMAIVIAASAGCDFGSEVQAIQGRILDDRVVLDRPSGPPIVWLELDNAGSRPCRLIVATTAFEGDAVFDPRQLPVRDGRVRTTEDTTGEPTPDEIHAEAPYAEIDGQPIEPDPGPPSGVVVEPGTRIRVQLALSLGFGDRPPAGAARILICDDPGDYEAGRYAVLGFTD